MGVPAAQPRRGSAQGPDRQEGASRRDGGVPQGDRQTLAEVHRKAQKQSPGGSPGKHARGGRGKSGSGQQQWWQQDWEQQEWKPKPKGKGKGKDGKGKGKDGGKGKQSGTLSDADFAAKRAEKQEELNAKHGQKDGKNPCFFHHGTPGGCRFDAADCTPGFPLSRPAAACSG